MKNNNYMRLWRVDWVHRSGYPAPHYWVEAKVIWDKHGVNEKETRKCAIQAAKLRSRLSDFPDTWSCKLTEE